MVFLFQIPLIVSYYTKKTPYEKEVENLIRSCKKFNLECYVEGIDDRGSWEENCAYKPYFMREKMQAFQRPLLWVDADAVFLQPLKFEDFMFSDVAFHYDPIEYHYDPKVRMQSFSVFAGTVYVSSTEGGLACLDLWCHHSDKIVESDGKAPPYSDQVSLHLMLLSNPPFNYTKLPIIYAKVFDRVIKQLDPREIVIEHHQASRRFK